MTEPGRRFVDSNAGYVVFGVALERLTGKAWEDLVREELFLPLKMPRRSTRSATRWGGVARRWRGQRGRS
ncbi:MAG: serine hydrolase [Labilithrix sp.]|nr:serine hydrolase [Labilithrix sp.]